MTDQTNQREQAEDAERQHRDTLTTPAHRLTVTLGGSTQRYYGPGYALACTGEPAASACHWWRDEEGDASTYRQHEECAVLDWFDNDPTAFIEEYTGPEHDGISSGLVNITSWGEDGFEWSYLEPAAPTETAVRWSISAPFTNDPDWVTYRGWVERYILRGMSIERAQKVADGIALGFEQGRRIAERGNEPMPGTEAER